MSAAIHIQQLSGPQHASPPESNSATVQVLADRPSFYRLRLNTLGCPSHHQALVHKARQQCQVSVFAIWPVPCKDAESLNLQDSSNPMVAFLATIAIPLHGLAVRIPDLSADLQSGGTPRTAAALASLGAWTLLPMPQPLHHHRDRYWRQQRQLFTPSWQNTSCPAFHPVNQSEPHDTDSASSNPTAGADSSEVSASLPSALSLMMVLALPLAGGALLGLAGWLCIGRREARPLIATGAAQQFPADLTGSISRQSDASPPCMGAAAGPVKASPPYVGAASGPAVRRLFHHATVPSFAPGYEEDASPVELACCGAAAAVTGLSDAQVCVQSARLRAAAWSPRYEAAAVTPDGGRSGQGESESPSQGGRWTRDSQGRLAKAGGSPGSGTASFSDTEDGSAPRYAAGGSAPSPALRQLRRMASAMLPWQAVPQASIPRSTAADTAQDATAGSFRADKGTAANRAHALYPATEE